MTKRRGLTDPKKLRMRRARWWDRFGRAERAEEIAYRGAHNRAARKVWKRQLREEFWQCKTCGGELQYASRYDSRYCPACLTWATDECMCAGDRCEFFERRPAIPPSASRAAG